MRLTNDAWSSRFVFAVPVSRRPYVLVLGDYSPTVPWRRRQVLFFLEGSAALAVSMHQSQQHSTQQQVALLLPVTPIQHLFNNLSNQTNTIDVMRRILSLIHIRFCQPDNNVVLISNMAAKAVVNFGKGRYEWPFWLATYEQIDNLGIRFNDQLNMTYFGLPFWNYSSAFKLKGLA